MTKRLDGARAGRGRAGALILMLAGACSVDDRPKTWEPLDQVALEEAMRSPTGNLSEFSAEDLLLNVPLLVVAMVQTIKLFDKIRDLGRPPDPDGGVDGDTGPAPDGGPDTGPPPDLGPAVDPSQSVDGASIYVKLACPGPDRASPKEDFSVGNIRVDSPTINSTNIDVTLVRGHLLLSFEDCQTEVATLSGEIPAYYDFAEDWLGLQLRLSARGAGEAEATQLDVGGIVDANRIRLLLQDTLGGTYVLTVRIDDGVAVSLTDSDQVIGCEYTEDPPRITCGSS